MNLVILVWVVLTIGQIGEPLSFYQMNDCERALEKIQEQMPGLEIQGSCVKAREPFK